MAHIYIYTVRRAFIDYQSQYIDLIPKLFGDYDIDIDEIYRKYNIEFSENYDRQLDMFDLLLKMDNNLLKNTTDDNYIDKNDINKIITLNLEQYNNIYTIKKFNQFIEHLHRGHGEDMKYGLYFGILYADNDLDFYRKININNVRSPNKRIIYYTKLINLLDYIEEIHREMIFSERTKLLYLNIGWQYGAIKYNSIILEKTCRNIDKEKFINDIKTQYPIEKITGHEELICQLPLPIELFKFSYVEDNFSRFKEKYYMLKKKYHILKNK